MHARVLFFRRCALRSRLPQPTSIFVLPNRRLSMSAAVQHVCRQQDRYVKKQQHEENIDYKFETHGKVRYTESEKDGAAKIVFCENENRRKGHENPCGGHSIRSHFI